MIVRPTPTFSLSLTPAEEALADASVALQMARVNALLGRQYDAEEYDRLLQRYRTAKQHADAARVQYAICLQQTITPAA
jgi:hypothetical protein